MKKLIYSLLLFFVSAFYISGCFFFKKDVMKDDADNVEEVMIVSKNGKEYFISKEEIFQATSKTSEGGFRTTSGFREYRLSSYDLNSGKLSSRIEIGEADDEYYQFLGPTEGKLWYYSMDKEIGLHARDPENLEIIVTENQITDANPELKNNFPKVKWYELRNYFGFDYIGKNPVISDNNGFTYVLNPNTLKAEKKKTKLKSYEYTKTITTSSISVNKNTYATLTGEQRKIIKMGNSEFQSQDFLKGHFLLSSNIIPLNEIYPEYFQPILDEIEKKEQENDSLENILNSPPKNPDDKWEMRKREYVTDQIKRNDDDIERKKKEVGEKNTDNNLIVSKDGGFFIVHNTTASDTAKILITKVILNPYSKTAEFKWTTLLNNIFADPGKVYEKGGFEYVFSKGSPNLSTNRVIYNSDKLLFLTMLKCVCIDTNSGNILWEITM